MRADDVYILSTLLDRYEKSALLKTGKSRMRIILRIKDDTDLQHCRETADGEHIFQSSVEKLEKMGLVGVEYERYQLSPIIDRIYLNTDAVDDAYDYLGRPSLLSTIGELVGLIRNADISDHDVSSFLENLALRMEEGKKIMVPFTDDMERNGEIIRTVSAVTGQRTIVQERVLSITLFNDSKYFENNLKKDVIRILKNARPDVDDDRVLASFGIVRYPEIIEFKGPLKTDLIDYSPLVHGAYMNSSDVEILSHVTVDAESVITIENKAVYIDYIRTSGDDELVIYTAGFPSPSLQSLLSLTYREDISFMHWGDIDLGGFKIFRTIKKVIPDLKPFRMDVNTLEENIGRCMKITDGAYLRKLEGLLEDEEYSVFHSAIKYMIENGVRLEQEALL